MMRARSSGLNFATEASTLPPASCSLPCREEVGRVAEPQGETLVLAGYHASRPTGQRAAGRAANGSPAHAKAGLAPWPMLPQAIQRGQTERLSKLRLTELP